VGTPVEVAPPQPPAGAPPGEATDKDAAPSETVSARPSPSSGLSGAPREAKATSGPGRGGLRYTLEGTEVRGNTTTLARVVLRYVPFKAGDVLDVDDKELELTRFRLLGTGYFRDVQLSLRRGSRRGYVVLVVTVVERNTIVVNDVWLGLSADAEPNGAARPLTAYGGIDVSEINLAGTGIAVGGALALADRQLALRTRFSYPQIFRSTWRGDVELRYNNARDFFGNRDVLALDPTSAVAQDYAVLSYRRFGGVVGASHDLGTSTQLFLDYRLERIEADVPPAASHRRGLDIEPIDFQMLPGESFLSTVRASIAHDTRDEPVLSTKGTYVLLVSDVSLTPFGSDYPYAKLQAHVSHWLETGWGHVLRLEAFAGVIMGRAPLFEKFYVGDFTDLLPNRALDLNFDRRAAPNFLNTDIAEIRYGDYAAKLAAEYRIPIYRGTRSVYGVDVFAGAGIYGVANPEDITLPARGYSGLRTVPVDLTFNLGLRVDTAAGGFAFGISNFLGFIPVRGAPP
jgi:outer membrane protein insertion porin family